MASKKTHLKKVLERFPEKASLIEELYNSSDSFRNLCRDFSECVNVIQRLDYSDKIIQCGYNKEYEMLLNELEEELTKALDEKTMNKKTS